MVKKKRDSVGSSGVEGGGVGANKSATGTGGVLTE